MKLLKKIVSHCIQIHKNVYNKKHMPAKAPTLNKKPEQALRELGQSLRDRRKELKINATVAAEAAEISRITLYRIEKGEPSVTMGAYLSVISSLGLKVDLINPLTPNISEKEARKKLPQKIPIAKFKELKRLAWQLKETKELTPQEALNLYERNWRHMDLKSLSPSEKKLIEMLLKAFGRERLLV